jgi:hypothetical protein
MRNRRNPWNIAAAFALLFPITACAPIPPGSPQATSQTPSIPYPKDTTLRDLDIVAVREKGQLLLTNRTPAAYARVQVWINQQYVQEVRSLPVGQTVPLPLNDFINQEGERFPLGGLLSPDKTIVIVLTELYLPERGATSSMQNVPLEEKIRYRLLTRQSDESRLGVVYGGQ